MSHANADKKYVDEFVASLLIRGAGLDVKEIFYSSEPDTGVRSGQTLMGVLRDEAGTSPLIIALVTPTYQTRQVCVAELGAAWARNVLFPLMEPGMKRSELEGVLPGLLIYSADDDGALNDLADRIRELGQDINMRSWGVGLEKWKSFLRNNPNVVLKPALPTADQINQLEMELQNARTALDDSETDRADLLDRIERLNRAKTTSEVLEANLPSAEKERFEALRTDVRSKVGSMPKAVVDALWHDISGQAMPMPNVMDDYLGHDSASEQVKVGRLIFDEDTGEISPDLDYPDVRKASNSIAALAAFLHDSDRSEEFTLHFEGQFDAPMNLRKKGCWDALI
ncbi:hypothetical protein [Brevibacterium sp. CS2]|uniref:hypothetical protein n=1 Tax=Brevibacterium sp. CS2 TaxID=2575923 RepID=UPI0015860E3B|nr:MULTISPECIES: hypothetical protein [Actinomycetes]MCX0276139.1 hypothetical protein [Nocardia zapadnayensis]